MANLPDFGKQIGPLPLGAWIVVVGGGLAIAAYTRNSSPEEPQVDTGGDSRVGIGGGTPGFIPLTPGNNPPPITNDKFTTNEEWARAAIQYLINAGYDAYDSDNAIRKYLVGSALSPSEYVLVRKALAHLGPPPQILPPGDPRQLEPRPTKPTPTTPTKPTTPAPPKPPAAPPKPAPKPPPAPAPNNCAKLAPGPASFGYLSSGSRGNTVRTAQTRLQQKGFDPGPIDGIFGPRTRGAVVALQQRYGLKVDGVIGRQVACVLGM